MSQRSNRLSPEEMQRLQRQEKLVEELRKILYNNFIFALKLQQVQKAFAESNDGFSFFKDKIAMRKLSKTIGLNNGRLNITLLNAIQEEWKYTQDEFWKGLKSMYSKDLKTTKEFENLKQKAESFHKDSAAEAEKFYNLKKGGKTISERIWKQSENIPREIDVLVQNAIKEGTSAEELARDLRKYLNEPDRIFRRVRNKDTGKLELSDAAKIYNPGQGVYRSSVKNAERLARTEINQAYRFAEWQSYQQNDLIKGFEIVLSNNTENQCSVCKRLAGIYPKWFLWIGWHPQCRCRMIAVRISQQEWKEKVRLSFLGKENEFKVKMIDELPSQFVEYIQENQERIQNAASLPYWYQDNRKVIEEILV